MLPLHEDEEDKLADVLDNGPSVEDVSFDLLSSRSLLISARISIKFSILLILGIFAFTESTKFFTTLFAQLISFTTL